VDKVLLIVIVPLVALLYISRYWQWFRYLRWKWKAIEFYERQDRRRKGICVECGYDLRGSPHRCPECGTKVNSAAARPNYYNEGEAHTKAREGEVK
jgi:predicted amidophosphoribosyltransferase